MNNRKRIYVVLSICITAAFLLIGMTWCGKSYARLSETIAELWTAMKYYFCELLEIGDAAKPFRPSNVLQGESVFLPPTPSGFRVKLRAYLALLIDSENVQAYWERVGVVIENVARFSALLLPVAVGLVLLVKRVYATPNNDYNRDTLPLRAFKKLSGVIYQPIKRFVIGYRAYLEDNAKWKTVWLWSWLGNINFLSIGVAAIAYYFYFAVSFDVLSLYSRFVDLFKDLLFVIRHFPWCISGALVWIAFCRLRESRARNILERNEARNCGFIKELPIVTMTCGSMGKKKTTLTTDMALSQTVLFRQEAFRRLQKQDMKFPFFPWICFENEIKNVWNTGEFIIWHLFVLGWRKNEKDTKNTGTQNGSYTDMTWAGMR